MKPETNPEIKDAPWNEGPNPQDLSGKSSLKSPFQENLPEIVSQVIRDNSHGRHSKGSGDPFCSIHLTLKLKEFNKKAKVVCKVTKEFEFWNESLRAKAVMFCQENGFNMSCF